MQLANPAHVDSHPSSVAFDVINETLQADAAERKDAINKANAVVALNIRNSSGEEQSWYIDLKEKGEVGQGTAPPNGKADGTPVTLHPVEMACGLRD